MTTDETGAPAATASLRSRQRVLPPPCSSRFPDGVKVENSVVTMPDLPGIGIGFEGKADLIKAMKDLAARGRGHRRPHRIVADANVHRPVA